MGIVISLDDRRRRRDADCSAVRRLDVAVHRLDGLVRSGGGRMTLTIERELGAIARAVTGGRPDDAADRAERLVAVLLHPAASGS
jgi:hypothetical protein